MPFLSANRHHKDRPCQSPHRPAGTATPHAPPARAADRKEGRGGVAPTHRPRGPYLSVPRTKLAAAHHESSTVRIWGFRPTPHGAAKGSKLWPMQGESQAGGLRQEGGTGLTRPLSQGAPANNGGVWFHHSTRQGQQVNTPGQTVSPDGPGTHIGQ